MDYKREEHSAAVLLTDGRVLIAGGDSAPNGGKNAQIFSPPYLFQGSRPTIGTYPPVIDCGTFTLGASQAPGAVNLVRLGSSTHGFDQNQRFVPLDIVMGSWDAETKTLQVKAPEGPYVAPPGYYMLFVIVNGVPSKAKIVKVDLNPSSNSTCNDTVVCTFDSYQCADASCSNATAFYGDTTGPGPSCGPDGVVDVLDRDAVTDAFENFYNPPCVFQNHDIAKARTDPMNPATACGPDGTINILDMFAVQDAEIGIDPCCGGGSAPPPCPPDTENPIIIFDPTPIYPSPAMPGDPIIAYDVDVHVYGFNLLRGYQVDLEITGPQASYAVISNITVDHTKPTYVFAATPSGEYDEAIDMTGLRMMGALRTGGVNVRSYLTTFRLDRAPGAPQAFSVTVQTKPQTQVSDPDGCQEFPPIINEIFPFE